MTNKDERGFVDLNNKDEREIYALFDAMVARLQEEAKQAALRPAPS
jgi:hypothetical protein